MISLAIVMTTATKRIAISAVLYILIFLFHNKSLVIYQALTLKQMKPLIIGPFGVEKADNNGFTTLVNGLNGYSPVSKTGCHQFYIPLKATLSVLIYQLVGFS